MPSPKILDDADLCTVDAARIAAAAVREAVSAHGDGRLVAPPRHTVLS